MYHWKFNRFISVLHLSSLPLWLSIVVAIGVGCFTALLVQFFMVPYLRKKFVGNSVIGTNEVRYYDNAVSVESVPEAIAKEKQVAVIH